MSKNILWTIMGIVLMNGIGMTVVFPLLPFLLGNYLPTSQIVVGMSALECPLGAISITLPFFVTAGIMSLSILTYFFLPESLSPEKRSTHFSIKSFNISSQFKDIFTMKEARALIGGIFTIIAAVMSITLSEGLSDTSYNGRLSQQQLYIHSVRTFCMELQLVL